MNERFIKFLLVFAALYFLVHIGVALADTVLINQPNGDQTICMIVGNIVQCYWESLSIGLNKIKELHSRSQGYRGYDGIFIFFF